MTGRGQEQPNHCRPGFSQSIPRVLIHLSALLLMSLVSCTPNEENIRRLIQEEMSKAMERKIVSPVEVIGPYSPAVRIGGFLFISGQIAINQKTGELSNATIEVETRQVLNNLASILHSEGYDSSHVASATVYLRNMEDYPKMNLVYGGYFEEGNYPARATVGVSDLPRGANVEIALVAYKNQ